MKKHLVVPLAVLLYGAIASGQSQERTGNPAMVELTSSANYFEVTSDGTLADHDTGLSIATKITAPGDLELVVDNEVLVSRHDGQVSCIKRYRLPPRGWEL